MLVSVIIITKNQKELLEQSLPVLLKQDLRGSYEIIVVDSGSTDGAIEYIKKLPVKLVKIRQVTFNFSNAFNASAKNAKGKYLVRLSGDVVPTTTDFLQEMIVPFVDPKVGGTYGRYTLTSKKPGYDYPNFWPEKRFPKVITRYSVKPDPVRMLFDKHQRDQVTNFAGGCCAVRREIWQKRPFNERLIGGEDAEYAWFLHLIGFDIVCNPKAKVIHEHKIKIAKAEFFSKWSILLVWEYVRYYLKKALGIDSFANLRQEFHLQTQ